MSVARGARYLEEARLRQQEGQRARTEARLAQLKLIELEERISDLERFKQEIQRKSTVRSLPFGSAYLFTFLLLFLFLLLSYYVFTSSLHPPTLDKN
jgi:hypothetical protein